MADKVYWSIKMTCFDSSYPIMLLARDEEEIHKHFEEMYGHRSEISYEIWGIHSKLDEHPPLVIGTGHEHVPKCPPCERELT